MKKLSINFRKEERTRIFEKFRLKAYKKWQRMKLPIWANLEINKINDAITYYSIPKQKKN
jgi:Fe-S cluster assembly protein SufB